MKRATALAAWCALILIVASGSGCITIRYSYAKWRVTAVGDICDRKTAAHLEGAQILRSRAVWLHGKSEENVDLLGTQAKGRFSVDVAIPVCRHYKIYSALVDKIRTRPPARWLVLRFAKEGYVTQEKRLNLSEYERIGNFNLINIDLGTILLDPSSPQEASSP